MRGYISTVRRESRLCNARARRFEQGERTVSNGVGGCGARWGAGIKPGREIDAST